MKGVAKNLERPHHYESKLSEKSGSPRFPPEFNFAIKKKRFTGGI